MRPPHDRLGRRRLPALRGLELGPCPAMSAGTTSRCGPRAVRGLRERGTPVSGRGCGATTSVGSTPTSPRSSQAQRPIAGVDPVDGLGSRDRPSLRGPPPVSGGCPMGPGVRSLVALRRRCPAPGGRRHRVERGTSRRASGPCSPTQSIVLFSVSTRPAGMGGAGQLRISCRNARRSSLRDPQGSRRGAHTHR